MMDEKLATDLQNRFNHHAPVTEDRAMAHQRVRGVLLDAAFELVESIPPGRERALFLTSLEEAMMWANAGIARAPEVVPE